MTKEQLLLLESLSKETTVSILEKINLLTFRKKWGGLVASPRLIISLTSGISRSVELISVNFSGNNSSAVFGDNTTEGIFFVSIQKIE